MTCGYGSGCPGLPHKVATTFQASGCHCGQEFAAAVITVGLGLVTAAQFLTLRLIPIGSTHMGSVDSDVPGHAPRYLDVRCKTMNILKTCITLIALLSQCYAQDNVNPLVTPTSVYDGKEVTFILTEDDIGDGLLADVINDIQLNVNDRIRAASDLLSTKGINRNFQLIGIDIQRVSLNDGPWFYQIVLNDKATDSPPMGFPPRIRVAISSKGKIGAVTVQEDKRMR